MRLRSIAAFAAPALFIAAAAPLIAQQTPALPGAPIASRVAAGTYDIDSAHTQLLFTVNHLGFSEYTGSFTNPTGTLVIDPKRPADAKLDVVFPIDKVQTTVAALDAHLKKPEFFDLAAHANAHYVSTSVVVKGTTATITGNLTMKGVTKPVTLNARFIGAGNSPFDKKLNIGFAATGVIKRSDFGVNYGIPIVSDKVDIVINAAFVGR